MHEITDSMKKAVIFGGSFNPITKGHEDIINKLSVRFDLVIVLVGNITPFKYGVGQEPFLKRFDLVSQVCKKYKNVVVSDYEYQQNPDSYSYLSVQYYKDMYNEYDFSFAIGSEMVEKLPQWQNYEYLKNNLQFYVISRPKYKITKKLDKYIKDGLKVEIADFNGNSYSSSKAKVDLSFDIYSQLSKKCKNYIIKNNMYKLFFDIKQGFKEFNLSLNKQEHTRQTAYASIELSKIHHINTDRAVISSLLHDITKNISSLELINKGIKLTKDDTNVCENVLHSKTGVKVAQQYFKIQDSQILDAISYHTTARADMTELEKIVFLADCIGNDRTYNGVKVLRKLAKQDLNKAMLLSLERNIKIIKSKNAFIEQDTIFAYEYFKNKE